MIELLLRLAVIAAVVGTAWLAVHGWERRRHRGSSRLAAGVTVITGPGCGLCDAVVSGLDGLAELVPVHVEDSSGPIARELGVRSLPTVFVVDAEANVLARRSGRSAVDDLVEIRRLATDSVPNSP